MRQWYQKRDYISVSDSDSIYNTNISSHSNLKDKALYNGNSGVKQTFILSIIYHKFREQRTCCMCTRKGITNIKHWQYSLVLFSVSPLINEPLTNCNNVYDWMLLHRIRTIQKEYNIIYVHKDIEMVRVT
jgi:hypothetical protein